MIRNIDLGRGGRMAARVAVIAALAVAPAAAVAGVSAVANADTPAAVSHLSDAPVAQPGDAQLIHGGWGYRRPYYNPYGYGGYYNNGWNQYGGYGNVPRFYPYQTFPFFGFNPYGGYGYGGYGYGIGTGSAGW